MTDTPANDVPAPTSAEQDRNTALVRKRYRAERRFRLYGLAAILAALGMLGVLLYSIVSTGLPTFTTTQLALDITFTAEDIDPNGTRDLAELNRANYRGALLKSLRAEFPGAETRKGRRNALNMISNEVVFDMRDLVLADPSIIGTNQRVWVKTSADIDQLAKGSIDRSLPESDRRVNDLQLGWFEALESEDRVRTTFNTTFFTSADSREPEQAGILGAVVGSALTLIITLLLSFPVGVMAAVYLEEFAPKNRWTDLIEVNINNLAAVPSIVFGLLGLAMFLNFFGLPRSAPVVGGMVLALMTLPTIIIASRAALKAVPPSIREAALGMGASRLQTVTHHVLPLAMPGILTGTIIGMAQALGETAPLLMIGMVAFIVDIPGGFTDPATVLPVQIFLWADAPERAFVERTSAAIMVLLTFLIMMNLLAVLLRKKFERRW
jgi:phosphate transport system permease protein